VWLSAGPTCDTQRTWRNQRAPFQRRVHHTRPSQISAAREGVWARDGQHAGRPIAGQPTAAPGHRQEWTVWRPQLGLRDAAPGNLGGPIVVGLRCVSRGGESDWSTLGRALNPGNRKVDVRGRLLSATGATVGNRGYNVGNRGLRNKLHNMKFTILLLMSQFCPLRTRTRTRVPNTLFKVLTWFHTLNGTSP